MSTNVIITVSLLINTVFSLILYFIYTVVLLLLLYFQNKSLEYFRFTNVSRTLVLYKNTPLSRAFMTKSSSALLELKMEKLLHDTRTLY